MTRIPLFFISLLSMLCLGLAPAAVAQIVIPTDSINQVDQNKKKQGFWHYKDKQTLDDLFPYTEYGYYSDDRKTGPWVRIDSYGRLKSIETYFKGALSGKVQYFDKGQLHIEGHFLNFDPDKKIDTVTVVDPISQMIEEVAIETEKGSMRHGAWKYYDPVTGHLIKTEIYQVDDLIKTIEHYRGGLNSTDSAFRAKVDQELPHNIDPSGKKYQKGKIRKSLIK